MSCLRCTYVVAAGQLTLPPALLTAEPALHLLCPGHFRHFVAERLESRLRAEREADRIWCSCGREIYFRGIDGTRSSCSGCELRVQPTVDVVAGAGVNLKPGEDWYRKGSCEEPGCDSSPFQLPDGRILCEGHGAPTKSRDREGRP